MTIKIPVSTVDTTLSQLILIEKRVALEADFLVNFASTLKNIIPDMTRSVKDFLGKMSFLDTNEGKTVEKPNAFLRFIATQNFIHYGKLSMTVPEGFVGHLPDYSRLLVDSVEFGENLITDVITPFNGVISGLINSENFRMRSKDTLDFLDKRQASRNKLNVKIGEHFQANARHTSLPINKVLQRSKDWDDLFDSLNKVRQYYATPLKKIKDEIASTIELLDALSIAAQNNDLSKVSSQQIKSLATHTLTLAREVEFYSITGYRVKSYDACLSDSVDRIQVALKDLR